MRNKLDFLKPSLALLKDITNQSHSHETAAIANKIWEKHLNKDNPLWNYLEAKAFKITKAKDSAHIIAMVDKRLPNIGIIGYFGCTDSKIGAEVIAKAVDWLSQKTEIKDIYGPINGTATSDYRLNTSDDFLFPGEPVNPSFYIDAFEQAGFKIFNNYGSGIVKHYKAYDKLFIKPPNNSKNFSIRAFDMENQIKDLRIFHDLMTSIFPEQSVYCPELSWEERLYNFKDKDPIFNPHYTYFLEKDGATIGTIVAYPWRNKLVIKTVCLIKDYRGQNLSKILVHKVHEKASKDKLEAVIYATVRIGNQAFKKRRPGLKTIRRYVTMKLSI